MNRLPARLVAHALVWQIGLGSLVAATGLLLGTSSVVAPALTVAGIVGLAVAAVAFRSLAAGVAVFTVITFFERIPGSGDSVTAVKLVSLALLLAWLAEAAERAERPSLLRDRPHLAWTALAFVVWAFASTVWALDEGGAASSAFRLAQMIFLVFVVFSAIRTTAHLRWLMWAFVAGIVLTALVGIASGTAFRGGSARFRGDFGNPNNLAAVELPALAFVAFLLVASRRPLERWILLWCGAILIATLFLTESRGGLVGLAAMAAVALLFSGSLRPRAVALILVVGVGAVVYFGAIAPQAARERVTDYSSASSTGRADLWNVALEISGDHPILGVGADNFTDAAQGYLSRDLNVRRPDFFLDRPQPVHNTYLSVLAELGAVGLTLVLVLLAGAIGVAVRSVRLLARVGDRESELLGRALVIGASGLLAAYFFFSAQFEKQLWLIVGALLALSSLARAAAVAREAEHRLRAERVARPLTPAL